MTHHMSLYHADPEWRAWWLTRVYRGKLRIGAPRIKPSPEQRAVYAKLRRHGIGPEEARRVAYGVD